MLCAFLAGSFGVGIALFDLDNTLIAGDSDYLWGCFLVEQEIVDGAEYEQANQRFYDQYKYRKQCQLMPTCLACNGTGKIKKEVCSNCKGTGGPAPWGRSDAHRAAAAKRYMIKMFLVELHTRWRELEGLEVRPPYREAVLGMPPHRGSQARAQA